VNSCKHIDKWKLTLNYLRRQLDITLRYCYSAGRATQNMSASRSLPTIGINQGFPTCGTRTTINTFTCSLLFLLFRNITIFKVRVMSTERAWLLWKVVQRYGSKLSQMIVHKQGNQKSIKSKFFCLFKSLWNVHKPNFMPTPWATP